MAVLWANEEKSVQPIIITASNNRPPFSFTLPNGKPTGLYIEFWQLWSETNGIPVVFEMTGFKHSIALVKANNRVHIGLFKNEHRSQWADFSIPFHRVDTGIIYSDKYPKHTRLSDLDKLNVAAIGGSYQANYLIENYPNFTISYYMLLEEALLKLLSGDVDAIVADVPALKASVAKLGFSGVFNLADEILLSNTVHGVVAKGQPELLDTINRGINQIPVISLVELEKKWLPTFKTYFAVESANGFLSTSEKNWLKSRTSFSLGTDTISYPFDFYDQNGNHSGISADYIDYVSEVLGTTMPPVVGKTWLESFEALKKGEVDIISAIIKTEDRAKLMNFTEPYFVTSSVIVTRKDSPSTESMESLEGRRVGLVKGYVMVELVSRDYPNISIAQVDSVANGLEQLHSGTIDAFIGAIAVINYEIDKRNLHDLIITAFAPYKFEISMAVRKGLEPLVPILNKTFGNMTGKQKSAIANNWLAVHVQRGLEIKTLLIWGFPIVLALMLIIFITFRANRKLEAEIKIRKKSELRRIALENQLHQSQKMEALGKLTGGIAHDFNNLLGIVLGYAELLRGELKGKPRLVEFVNYIYHAGERGSKLTNKLLSFSSKQSIEAGKIDINSLLLDQQDILQKSLTVRIELIYDLDSHLWPVWIDKSDLEDAILNMSVNAMHAMTDRETQNKLTIRTVNQTIKSVDILDIGLDSGDYVQLSITDTGSGMDDSIMKRIFEPFFSTKGGKGTGLGLSQVFGFVKRAGGTIKVYSEKAHGTQFVLYFPRYQEQEITHQTIVETQAVSLTGDETILVVDDEPSLRNVTSLLLKKQGYKVFSAENAEKALSILAVEKVDLMLSDVVMPHMDGYQLTATVQEKYPQVKVQLASGFSDDRHLDMVDKQLHTNLLRKPYSSQKLFSKIRNLLDS